MQADKNAVSKPHESRTVTGTPSAVFMSGGGKGVVEDKTITLMINMGKRDETQAGLTIGVNELAMSMYAALDFDKTSSIWESIIDDNEIVLPGTNTSFHVDSDPVKHMKNHRNELSEFIDAFEKVLLFMKADLPRYDQWIENHKEEED